jgi:hypothetical protein
MFMLLGNILTLNLLTTTIVAPPSNVSKWQMGFNSAFKGLIVYEEKPNRYGKFVSRNDNLYIIAFYMLRSNGPL